MIYLDTNVLMYAVGRRHPLREEVRTRLASRPDALVTSAETMLELLHAYLPVRREVELDAALVLLDQLVAHVHPIEPADVLAARDLAITAPSLTARDLVHLAVCLRYEVDELWTYDRGLGAAFDDLHG